jgi:hypothetical protein
MVGRRTYAQLNPPSEDASPIPSSSYPSHAGAPNHELFAATLYCCYPAVSSASTRIYRIVRGLGRHTEQHLYRARYVDLAIPWGRDGAGGVSPGSFGGRGMRGGRGRWAFRR